MNKLPMIKFVADSGCNIFELADADFSTAALKISSDERTFVDDKNLELHEMLEYLLSYKGRSFTSCPSADEWMQAFLYEDGSIPKEIYVVTLTSGLSGTYNSACLARNMFLEKHPETKILVVDSLSVGVEMTLILEKLVEFKKSGMTFEEIESSISSYVKKARLFFSFKSIHNLAQNGRVNKLAAAAAGALNLRILGTASDEGTIENTGKVRGDKRAIATLMSDIEAAGCKGGKFHITHVEDEALAASYADAIRAKYPDAEITITPVRGLCAYYCERSGICIGCEC